MEFIFFFFLRMITQKLHLRGVFCLVVLLSCLLIAATCEPCQVAGNEAKCDAYRSYLGADKSFPGVLGGDLRSKLTQEASVPQLSLDGVCPNANLFCFPSTLPGFVAKKDNSELTEDEESNGADANGTGMLDCGIFRLLGGRSVSCLQNYQDSNNQLPCFRPGNSVEDSLFSSCSRPLHDIPRNLKTKQVDDTVGSKFSGGSLPSVEVTPPMLDWGEKFLYFPSLAYVTVMNTHRDNILYVYEPYSTNSQFYPCNSSEISLAPGEAASVCFVFLPTTLGLSSARLVLQTNYGGFLVHAKGFAVESLFDIQPVVLDVSSSGRWRKNLSLFNPFDEALYVEEVVSWVSVSSGNASYLTKTVCSISNTEDSRKLTSSLNAKQWLNIIQGGIGSPLVSMRPHGDWVVGPQERGTVMELGFSWDSEAKIFGALHLQLLRSAQNNVDTVIIPLEAELTKKTIHDEYQNFVSFSLDTIVPCSYSGTAFLALFVRNDSPHVLSIVDIRGEGDSSQLFRVKYMKGLIIFPYTVTQVASISYYLPDVLGFYSSSQTPQIDVNCKIVLSTNGSSNSRVEIPCEDIASVCSSEKLENFAPQVWVGAEADEAVLKNWKSQATASDMSVVDENEVVFPVIEVGHFSSEWITVRNPSPKPVMMQLILNSAEIIDECRATERHLQSSSSSKTFLGNSSAAPARYGFSIADDAVTEALVHPFSTALLGPVWFHPGSQCKWKSCALIRNNLSGVEWVSLSGFGGSLLMVLLEETEPIQSLDFKINSPNALNTSFPADGQPRICSQRLSKEVYAKNIGDIPLRVKRIEISGTECELDGFVVSSCKGFSLEPGESKKIMISYQIDFSVATIQRDLELALTNGILVIPMKATLPMYMLSFCKKPFLGRIRKSLGAMLLVAFLLFLVTTQFRKSLVNLTFDSRDYIPRSGKTCSGTIYYNQTRIGKPFLLSKIIGLIAPSQKSEPLLLERSYSDSKPVNDREEKAVLPDDQEKSVLEIGNSGTQEPPQVGNLRVKVGNEKSRRRRKKRASAGVNGLLDVSSSHSGNSTPSSPLSPASSSTPKRSWPQSQDSDQMVQITSPFVQVSKSKNHSESEPQPKREFPEPSPKSRVTTLEKPTESKKLSDSPSPGNSLLASSSLSPFAEARAPGSKLSARKSGENEGATTLDQRFVYDIWGNHLFGLPLTGGSSKDVSMTTPAAAIQNNSDSFFVRGPQILMNNSSLQKVVSSSDHEG